MTNVYTGWRQYCLFSWAEQYFTKIHILYYVLILSYLIFSAPVTCKTKSSILLSIQYCHSELIQGLFIFYPFSFHAYSYITEDCSILDSHQMVNTSEAIHLQEAEDVTHEQLYLIYLDLYSLNIYLSHNVIKDHITMATAILPDTSITCFAANDVCQACNYPYPRLWETFSSNPKIGCFPY